ncbi:MAG: ABC transporter permease [Kiritimatiellae bacterium]|nr:ABC transporter permease [Kiritimatiellia bacterium]
MNLFIVSLKNLRHKRIRTALSVGGVGIAVAVLVSLLGFDAGYQEALQTDIDRMGYQVLVTAKGCPYEAATLMLKGGGGLRYMDQTVYEKIISDKRIDKITPQLVATAFDPERSEGRGGITLFMGITSSYRELKPWMKFHSGNWFSSNNAAEVIMGYEVAELEQRSVGDNIFIPGHDNILKVAGIFERTGTQDDGIIFMPLGTTQKIFELPEKITGIGIKLKDLTQLSAFEEDLYNEPAIQVISMAQVKGTIFNLMSSARILANAIATVAVVIAAIGVINTILMSVFERTREIGVMKALGASQGEVFCLIWVETTLVCFIGGVIGSTLAVIGGRLVEYLFKQILPYAPSGRLIIISPILLLSSLAGTIIIGLLAGLYPAARAAAMRPVEAIRTSD